MTNLLLSLLFAFGLPAPHSAIAQGAAHGDRDTVLKACAAEFGPAIDAKNGLFEVNRFYLLEAKFDNRGRLAQLGVLPKHWFADQHPEWDETDDVGELTETEYASLLGRLEGVRPKGQLRRRAKRPVVKAATATRRDTYTRAVLLTGDVVDARRSEDAPRTIKYFIVYYAAAN